MITRTWRVYGAGGHRQRESFSPSYTYNCTKGDDIRIIEVENSDKTGTNEFSLVRITRNTAEECENELWGQISDGIFENSRVGQVIEDGVQPPETTNSQHHTESATSDSQSDAKRETKREIIRTEAKNTAEDNNSSTKYAVKETIFEFNPRKTPNIEDAFWTRHGDENADTVALYDTIEEARAHLEKIDVHTRVYDSTLADAWVAYIEESEYEWDDESNRWEWSSGVSFWDFRVEELTDEEDEEDEEEEEEEDEDE